MGIIKENATRALGQDEQMSEDTDFNEGRERGQERVARLLQLDVHQGFLLHGCYNERFSSKVIAHFKYKSLVNIPIENIPLTVGSQTY